MADNNVILIPLKAIVTLYHHHNHMLVETMKICLTKKDKLRKIKELQCKERSTDHQKIENKLNIMHFDKFNSSQQNTTLNISHVSIKNNKINTSTTEVVTKLLDDNKIIEPIKNVNFESPEEYDKYILVENLNTQSSFHDNNESELNQLISDYDIVNKRILQQFGSNPNYFKSAIKYYTLVMNNSLTSKESLLNALHSFGKQK